MTKFEIELENAAGAALRIKDDISKLIAMTGPNGHKVERPEYMGKDMAIIVHFLSVTAQDKVDEIKALLD